MVGTSSYISMMISDYSIDLHIYTMSLRSFAIRASSASPSDAFFSLASKRNSKASPNPFPVYKYSSSFGRRAGLCFNEIRVREPMTEGAGDVCLKFEGETDWTEALREREDVAGIGRDGVGEAPKGRGEVIGGGLNEK